MKCEISVVYLVYTCKASKIELHQSIAALTWWCGPQPRLGWVNMVVGLAEGPSYPGHSLHTNHFSPCSPLNHRKRVARSYLKIGLPSLSRLLILLLVLRSGNVHPNLCPVFPCLVCTGNVTWRGRSVQCCTCSNWVHLKCSPLSFSRFGTLGSSHSWSCSSCCVSVFFWRSHTYQHCDSVLGLIQLVYLHCSIWPPSVNAALTPHPRLQTSYPFSAHFVSSPSAPSPPPHAPGCFSLPPASSSLP